jgi:hypothetical protein
MDGGKIGDGPWGCLLVCAIIGILAVISFLIIGCIWLYKHVHIL